MSNALPGVVSSQLIENLKKRKRWLEQRGRPFALKKPAMTLPKTVERRSRRLMRRRVNALAEVISSVLLPRLPQMLKDFDQSIPGGQSIKRDDLPSDLETTINEIRVIYGRRLTDAELRELLEAQGIDASEHNAKQLNKVVGRVIPIDLFGGEQFLRAQIQAYVAQSVRNIKNVEDQLLKEIADQVFSGARRGLSTQEISSIIRERTRVAKSRADLIARDQLNKLNGQLTKVRQQDVGVSRYVWRTSIDERVRGNPGGLYPDARPSHWDREGKIYSWDKPPTDGHPGEPIQCRCYAEPIIEDLLEE